MPWRLTVTMQLEKAVNMIRKYQIHTLQSNPRHHVEEPQNTNSHQEDH